MKVLIIIEYFINLIILLFYYIHMFQLNSYFLIKQLHWMKQNIKKIIIQVLLVSIAGIFIIFRNIVCDMISIIILGVIIFNNLPKNKSKIELKITNRIKRMIFTETILILMIILINYKDCLIVKLIFLNIISPIICIVANFINYPVEYIGKKYYINSAKRILKSMPNLIVIGITGSFGKTSVKNFLEKILQTKYEVLTTPKNYNTTMGVVKTIRENLKPTHQIFICEMGATKPKDIKEICEIVKPNIGVITAIGPQHLQSFKTIENIIKTKFELVDSVKENGGVVFLNFDNQYIAKQKIEENFITYGVNNTNLNYKAFEINASSEGTSFSIYDKDENKNITFSTKLIGKHNIVNITAAIAVGKYLGISFGKMINSVKKLKNVKHRLELIKTKNLNIIDDSYNSNPISAKLALDTLSEFNGKKIIVTPGLVELGKEEEKYNIELGKQACKICDYIYLVNSKQSKYVLKGIESESFDKNKLFNVSNPNEAMRKILNLGIKEEITVLLENDLPDNYNL